MQVRWVGVTHGNGKLANTCVRVLVELNDGKDGDSNDDGDTTFLLYLQLNLIQTFRTHLAHSVMIDIC